MEYQLLPNKPRKDSDCHYVAWQNVFSENEIQRILDYVSNLEKIEAEIGANGEGRVHYPIRKSFISWIHNVKESQWIWDRMAYIIRDVSSNWYGYNLTGFKDGIQYGEYHENGGHYNWHVDSLGENADLQRKLSISVQLSDPSEYDGGELQLFTGTEPTTLEKEKGFGAIFPSFRLHRVTPVTRGVRKSLVLWANGPSFI